MCQTLASYQAGGDSVYGSKLDSELVSLCSNTIHAILICVFFRLQIFVFS